MKQIREMPLHITLHSREGADEPIQRRRD